MPQPLDQHRRKFRHGDIVEVNEQRKEVRVIIDESDGGYVTVSNDGISATLHASELTLKEPAQDPAETSSADCRLAAPQN